ncbi:MAG: hypothetical protein E6J03_08715 [Chloroflexi bacterium]|nr:MAG: hypothetical protein E6J03_08715 [Chloroflexota bacterium]
MLLPVLVGILTLASMVHTDLAARAAAAAGVRSAASAGGFGPGQLERVRRELRDGGVDPGGCSVSATPSTVGLDEPSLRGMDETMARFLSVAALARATLLVAGATGSGKSTLLRSIVDAFPDDERVITIEDTAELELANPHWVRLECVHEHRLEGRDTSVRRLDVADLVQNALRMRPDRLIIGEIRNSREAYHTLEALNTGHDGSATTIHAGTAAGRGEVNR